MNITRSIAISLSVLLPVFFGSKAFAHPITYVFTGEVTDIYLQDWQTGEIITTDPNAPATWNGTQLTDGSPSVVGSYTFDSSVPHLGGINGPWASTDDPCSSCGITYQLATEGILFYKTPGVWGPMSFDYNKSGVTSHFEGNGPNNPPVYQTGFLYLEYADFAFNFSGDDFQGGNFMFQGGGIPSGHLGGVIDHVYVVDAPEPPAISLLLAGVLGIFIQRRFVKLKSTKHSR